MADVPETLRAAMISGAAAESGLGVKFGIYSAVKTTPTDTVTFDKLTEVVGIIAINVTGDLDPITSVIGNQVTMSVGTGTTSLYVWGY